MEKIFTLKDLDSKKYEWLKNSDFYREFSTEEDENEEEILDVKFCSKNEKNIRFFFDVINFWGINYLPKEFYYLLYEDKTNFIDYLSNLKESVVSDLYKFLITFKNTLKENLSSLAVTYNRIDCLEFLINYNLFTIGTQEKNLCNISAKNGNLDVFRFCLENGENIEDVNAIISCYGGNLDILKISLQNGSKLSSKCFMYSSIMGHLDIIKYLFKNECPLDEDSLYYASTYGHLEVLKYLFKNEGRERILLVYVNILPITILYNHFECAKFLIDNGSLPDSVCMYNAILNNNIKIIKYLINKEVQFNTTHFDAAIKLDDINLIKYLRENGCPIPNKLNTFTLTMNIEIIEYCETNGIKLNGDYWCEDIFNGYYTKLLHNITLNEKESFIYLFKKKLIKEKNVKSIIEAIDSKSYNKNEDKLMILEWIILYENIEE